MSEAFSEDDTDLAIRVVSRTDKKSISIGEKLYYIISVYTRPDIEIEFPKTQDMLGSFEVKGSGIGERSAFGKTTITKWYRLTGYETGEQTIPGLTIRYQRKGRGWKDISSNKVTVTVQSVFERAKIGADIREIEPPISFGWAYRFHIMAGSAILILILWAALIFIKKRNRRLKEISQGPPEDALIYDRLNNLILSLHNKKDMSKEDFINITQLTREYLEHRFKLPTREMTTEEFLSSTRAIKGVFEKYEEFLSNFLRTCDLMKFANYNPKAEESNRYLLAVSELLDDINIRPEGEGAR